MFGFGDKAAEIINDNDSAYHLREILLGKEVIKPKK